MKHKTEIADNLYQVLNDFTPELLLLYCKEWQESTKGLIMYDSLKLDTLVKTYKYKSSTNFTVEDTLYLKSLARWIYSNTPDVEVSLFNPLTYLNSYIKDYSDNNKDIIKSYAEEYNKWYTAYVNDELDAVSVDETEVNL